MSHKNVMEMSRDEYMDYMGERLAKARQARRERHRAYMEDYMAWRKGGGVVFTRLELETLINVLASRPDAQAKKLYTKIMAIKQLGGTK